MRSVQISVIIPINDSKKYIDIVNKKLIKNKFLRPKKLPNEKFHY
tara:strand:- start:1032 stop:1166 length:135 start_codon:yes stop_codon:yes gene_type:complete